jgi:GntR family transcriptional regulator, transcriptional repressor for pyruvate dehydrogenase complex
MQTPDTAFQLRTVDRSKLYTSIVDQIAEGIRSGAFPPGKALPAERILATQLGVSRSSVREAIRVLEHAGVLDVRTGSGTFVSEEGLSKAATLRAHAALLGDQSPLDVMVARRALEPLCAELAAANRRRGDIEVLREMINEQKALVEASLDPAEVDLRFHLAVAAAGHNPVLLVLLERLIEIMGQSTWRELKYRSNERHGTFLVFLHQHSAILDAIERSDSTLAGTEMRTHLAAVEAGLLAEVPGE